jgi:hypothetical protein
MAPDLEDQKCLKVCWIFFLNIRVHFPFLFQMQRLRNDKCLVSNGFLNSNDTKTIQ